ncbi:hypothetical protein HZS55_04540 [Halosimplex rubrum]|uniref:Type VII secretion protein EccE n=1 Tax=Halosimplex rubrum TaxID=869889 RepID=A0A7D5NZ36_9EURY|nr:hypothetical protein [Halosimplex rubrum]QLH76617.1 hypothetical protein HZS55_04540 [Halosimplex rubrum]
MSDHERDGAVRAVEVGEVLPRVERAARSPATLGAVLAVGFAAALAVAVATAGPVRLLAVVPAAAAAALAVRLRRATRAVLPAVPSVDLRAFPEVDPGCIADHLVGSHGGPPRGLPGGELVVAELDTESADRLARIPDECASRWSDEGLHTVLVAVPRAPADVVESVAESYDATLLVSDPADIQPLLGYLPDLMAEPESDALTGVGSATVRQTPVDGRLPGDPALREDLKNGKGKPLNPVVESLREEPGRRPRATILSAPRDYVSPALTARERTARRLVTVQHDEPTVDLVRFYLADELSGDDRPVTWRRNSIREDDPERSRRKPDRDCRTPDDGAPEADRRLGSEC